MTGVRSVAARSAGSRSRISPRARCRRDLTVPTGMPSVAATSVQRHARRSSAGRRSRALVRRGVEGRRRPGRGRRSRPAEVGHRRCVDRARARLRWTSTLRRRIKSRQALTSRRWSHASKRSGSRRPGRSRQARMSVVLDRVARELRVPEDQAGGLRPAARRPRGRARRRRHARPSPRSLDETSLVHLVPLVRHGRGGRARHRMASASRAGFLWRCSTADRARPVGLRITPSGRSVRRRPGLPRPTPRRSRG